MAESSGDRKQMTRIALISEAKGQRLQSVEAVERAVEHRPEVTPRPSLGRWSLKVLSQVEFC